MSVTATQIIHTWDFLLNKFIRLNLKENIKSQWCSPFVYWRNPKVDSNAKSVSMSLSIHVEVLLWEFISTPHYNDVIMGAIASQITNLTIGYSTVHSDADQSKHQSSASLASVRGIHREPVNSPQKWPVMRKMFHLMTSSCYRYIYSIVRQSPF